MVSGETKTHIFLLVTIFVVVVSAGFAGSVTASTTDSATNDASDEFDVVLTSNESVIDIGVTSTSDIEGNVSFSILLMGEEGEVIGYQNTTAYIPPSSSVNDERLVVSHVHKQYLPENNVTGILRIETNGITHEETFSIPRSVRSSNVNVSVGESVSIASISPDYSLPEDEYRVYYSGDVDEDSPSVDYSEYENDYSVNASDIGNLLDGESGTIPPGVWARYNDLSFDSAGSAPTLSNVTWIDYQLNQLQSIQQSDRHSIVVKSYEDETHDDGVIKDTYITSRGTIPGVQPLYEDTEYMVPQTGGVMTYFDYRLDPSVLPDDTTDDVVTHTDSSKTPSWASDKYKQTQERTTYQIENYSSEANVYVKNDTGEWINVGEEQDSGGFSLDYALEQYGIGNNTLAEFLMKGVVESNSTRYLWNRNRTRQFNVRENVDVSGTKPITVSGSKTVSGTATATASGRACTYETSTTNVDTTKTYTITENWYWETSVSRDYTFTEDVDTSVPVSGYICGDLGNESSGTVTGTISGSKTITADYDTEKTVRYEWWPSWNPWYIDQTWLHSHDEVNVDDTFDGRVVSNNGDNLNITSINVQVGPDRYHSFVDIEYDSDRVEDISPITRFNYGEETYVSTDWKLYSAQDISSAYKITADGREEVSIPNQMELYMFNEGDGLEVTTYESVETSSYASSQGATLANRLKLTGFVRENMSETTVPMDPDVQLNATSPAYYTRYSVRNAPEKLTSVENVMGKTVDIDQQKTIQYVRPNVEISYGRTTGDIDVVVESPSGTPVRAQELFVSSPSKTYGTYTTDENGSVTVNATPRMGYTHLTVEVSGDTWSEHIDNESDTLYRNSSSEETMFVGRVIAQKTIGASNIFSHMRGLVFSSMLATPIVLFYLLWRDGQIGM